MTVPELDTAPQPQVPPPADEPVVGRGRRARRRQGRRRRTRYLAIGAPLLVLLLIIGAWAIDTRGTRVVRNVEIGGHAVGGETADELEATVADLATDYQTAAVRIVSPEQTYETTAGELGLTLDQAATVEAARDEGRDEPVLLRPFTWLASLFSPREVPLRFEADETTVDATLAALEAERRIAPVEPTIQAGPEGVVVVPGTPGSGLDAGEVAGRLVEAAAGGELPIEVEADARELPPRFTEADAQAVADQANTLAAVPLTVTVVGQARPVAPAAIQGWARAVAQPDALVLDFDRAAVTATLGEMFADIAVAGVNARFDLVNGQPVVVPAQPGRACCEPAAADKVVQALVGQTGGVEVAPTPAPAEFTTEEANAFRITQPVGGARAWPVSRQPGVGPGFTTFHSCCESRVTNIHRIADMVRGAIIPPGGSFSVNDFVGERTRANGFVSAGAIRDGMHVQEVGGGVSQFATTLFNAAYFAGLDIVEYQAHSEYLSRYPRGREATMGYPNPDLEIVNSTPYGAMIWTSYTGTSLTVTMYSTPFATGEQTGISEGRSGNCTTVTTTRTRTYVDGRPPVTDTFSARYRPGEGINC
jgi:vancomycin resistance protein YoaR